MAELNLRASAIKAIKRIHDRVSGFQQGAFDEFHLQQELKSLSAHYARFVTNHDLLVGNAANAELEAHEKLWEEVEGIYNNACTHLNRAIMGAKPSQSAVMPVRECEVKLEPLAIPTFDGTMQNWLAFKDVFELLVHNTDYPEAYKLGKLRQAVSASAVPLVGSVYSGGYADLWKALKERFDNRRQLAETHVSRLLNIKPTTEDTPTALLFIVDTVHESLRALHVMGLPVAEWDAVVVPIIVSKLPITTQREWNMKPNRTEPKFRASMSCLRFWVSELIASAQQLSHGAMGLNLRPRVINALVVRQELSDHTSYLQRRVNAHTAKVHIVL